MPNDADDSFPTQRDGSQIAPTEVAGLRGGQEVGIGASLPGYALGPTIGVGGMGEVVLGHDDEIGRDVAIKRINVGMHSPAAIARFLREARIQARLEHPAIVPVHELGRDSHGLPFFTMKRLTGVTLADQLRAEPRPSLQMLLRALIDVCLAIEFAHARAIIHRDLKPANIMLGDFGEVYVLDWGIARALGQPDDAVVATDPATTNEGMTEVGAVLGTPGYMPPEQLQGSSEVGPAADVYALGAILFELLAGERLHGGGKSIIASTLGDHDGSPARRRPERGIAPELDTLCIAALAYEPAARPSARALADGIQRYLDGDRDLAQRRTLAASEVASARAVLESGELAGRPDAVRSAARALALDPESREAAALITRLMLEPTRELPPALTEALTTADAAVQRRQSRAAMMAFGAVLVFLAAAALNGPRDIPLLVGITVYTLLLAALSWNAARRTPSKRELWFTVVGNAALAALLSRVFGPLIIAPVVTCTMAVSLTSYPQLVSHARTVIVLLVASWLAPVGLERLGVLEPTWRIEQGSIVSMSQLVEIGGDMTAALLLGANVLAITVIGLFANALARSRREAQRAVEIQAWHLRHLLPASRPQ